MRIAAFMCGLLALMGGKPRPAPSQVICLVPFAGVPAAQVEAVKQAVATFYHLPVAVLPTEQLPKSAICPVRQRYRARAVLDYLAAHFPATPEARTKLLALTTADIEYEAPPEKPHWGVFGLANRVGGDECIASTFRLGASRTDRLIKVSLHEVGHMLHLPHCEAGMPRCLMNDGQGKVATVDAEDVFLCDTCRARLRW